MLIERRKTSVYVARGLGTGQRDQCLSPAEKSSNGGFTPCCSRANSAMLTLDL